MAISFSPLDPATWPLALTIHDVAAIYQTTPTAIRHRLTPSAKHRFVPAPFQGHPYRWRRADVLRHLEGARRIA